MNLFSYIKTIFLRKLAPSIILIFTFTSGAFPMMAKIFNDDFSNNAGSRWPDNRHGAAYMKNGAYTINSSTGYFIALRRSPVLKEDTTYTITVETIFRKGHDVKGYGIVFRASGNNNFYFFIINVSGNFRFGYRKNGKWGNFIKWKESQAIRKGYMNKLTVELNGTSITGLINGEQVFTIDDNNNPIKSGQIGLISEKEVHSEFDNLSLWTGVQKRFSFSRTPSRIKLTEQDRAEQKKLFKALEEKDTGYFSKIDLNTLKRINVGKYKSTTAIYDYCTDIKNRENIAGKYIPAMIGVFKNSNSVVRGMIYHEICFSPDRKELLHGIDLNMLYGVIMKQDGAKSLFKNLYNMAFNQRGKEQGNNTVWQQVIDLAVYCQFANMSFGKLCEKMILTGFKPKLQIYFHQIQWEHLKKINGDKGGLGSFINNLARRNKNDLAAYMWVLMGGFRNQDPRCRTMIYKELLFPGIPGSMDLIKKHPDSKNWLKKLRTLMSRRDEDDAEAKEYFDKVKVFYSGK